MRAVNNRRPTQFVSMIEYLFHRHVGNPMLEIQCWKSNSTVDMSICLHKLYYKLSAYHAMNGANAGLGLGQWGAFTPSDWIGRWNEWVQRQRTDTVANICKSVSLNTCTANKVLKKKIRERAHREKKCVPKRKRMRGGSETGPRYCLANQAWTCTHATATEMR